MLCYFSGIGFEFALIWLPIQRRSLIEEKTKNYTFYRILPAILCSCYHKVYKPSQVVCWKCFIKVNEARKENIATVSFSKIDSVNFVIVMSVS